MSDFQYGRREFLRKVGAGAIAAGAAGSGRLVVAGPFRDANEYLETIPTDKRLDPAWIASLTARGVPRVVTDPAALAHIGMPVGGLCAGQLYLGGDGRLWLWDIFNRIVNGVAPRPVVFHGKKINPQNGANYVSPTPPVSPVEQGFAVRVDGKEHSLDARGFRNVSFRGQYPIGEVSYRDDAVPVEVKLEAYSPFTPLMTADSSLPATVLSYTVVNTSKKDISLEILGRLENAICLYHRDRVRATLCNRVHREPEMTALVCSAEREQAAGGPSRPDIVFDDFERETYGDWTATGTAFGKGPIAKAKIPPYQGDVGGEGARVVNSHNVRSGEDVGGGDRHTGTLTSREFTISRKFIGFYIGGGSHRGKTCLNLLAEGKVVRSATGRNANRMARASFEVSELEGKKARLEIVDKEPGPWGNIGVDHIVFSDRPPENEELEKLHDFGTLALAVAASGKDCWTTPEATSPLQKKLTGAVGRKLPLAPGEKKTVTFILAWHFPNLSVGGMKDVGRWYAARFTDARAVAAHVAGNLERLESATRLWRDTWYDSTLPYWFLDRTMANTTTLATSTCHRFRDGRFWAWEGIGCCQGTCTHVWHYAQAVGRLFPEIERVTRERVDFGLGFHASDGGISHRVNRTGNAPADDGQCGRILGVYREHQMSSSDAFLRRLWPKVRKAVEYLIRKDGNGDGIIEGAQPNTLDAAWFGKIPFLASLYLATLRAGAAMAREMGDEDFALQCDRIAAHGARSILELFNGEYFFQIEDPNHKDAIGVGDGCYIDQVFGQSWAHQVALGRLFDREKQVSALRSLWKYNFVPDVGPFREKFPRGRWYAVAGDAGLLMCTWPRGGKNPGFKKHWQYMYFNECMTGFEWEVAAHMIFEGMVTEGLAVARAIEDRYDASLRNPYNEVECSDHYARAMASYGAFIAACGFEYHGPKGSLAMSPRITPEDFRAAFTAAEGWGSISQRRESKAQVNRVELRWGRLRLRRLGADLPEGATMRRVVVRVGDRELKATASQEGRRVTAVLRDDLLLEAGGAIEIRTAW